MLIVCPNCQTQNEQGNRFCKNCGTALTQPVAPAADVTPPAVAPAAPPAAAPAPPAAAPAPPAAAPAPPAPVYAAAPMPAPAPAGAGMAAVQRLPRGVLIGGVATSMLVVAVGAFLLVGGHNDPAPGASFSIPSFGPGPGTSQGPGVTPGPIVNPGGGSGTGTQDVDVKNISVTVPATWEVKKKEDTQIWLARPGGGLLILISGKVDDGVTADTWLDKQVAGLKDGATSFEICHEREDTSLFAFAKARSTAVCYSAKTQSGQAFSAVDWLLVGVDAAHIVYHWEVFANAEVYDQASKDIIDQAFAKVVWKLAP